MKTSECWKMLKFGLRLKDGGKNAARSMGPVKKARIIISMRQK